MQVGNPTQITPERVELLEKVNFNWSPREKIKQLWYQRYEELIEFKHAHNHCNVPKNFKSNKSLATWVDTQRYQYKKLRDGLHSQITAERIELLNQISFHWTVDQKLHDVWWQRYKELLEYKQKHGHLNIPMSDEETKKLANWSNNQRSQYKMMREGKSSQMTEHRARSLEKIGFC